MIDINDLQSFNQDHEVSINLKEFNRLGGLKALEQLLSTSYSNGLVNDNDDFNKRIKLYGKNELPEPPSKTWVALFLETFDDTTIRVLMVAAVVSLAIGLYENPSNGWIEGTAILSAVLIVALVTATNNYNKDTQFRKLNAKKEDTKVNVIRDGIIADVHNKFLVVGDIIQLNTGDKIPADGILIEGSDVTCNESALTGESEDKIKSLDEDMFLLSGSTLSTGFCKMLVTSVGKYSRWGKTKAKLNVVTNPTPLQEKLDVLAGQIGNFGFGSAIATFIAMIIFYFYSPALQSEITLIDYMLKAFIMAVTIIVVAVPEGLPLAVTLSLAYSTQKMMLDNNLIRVLEACETMGNATNICSDKTGTLTQNRMTVTSGYVSGHFYEQIDSNTVKLLSDTSKSLLIEGISVNTTATLLFSDSNGKAQKGSAKKSTTDLAQVEVSGNKTEGALLMFLYKELSADYSNIRKTAFNSSRGDKYFTFTSTRKRMSVLLRNDIIPSTSSSQPILYTKGASEVIVSLCRYYIDENGEVVELTDQLKESLHSYIDIMAKQALRTIGLAHRYVKSEQLKSNHQPIQINRSNSIRNTDTNSKNNSNQSNDNTINADSLESDLVLDAIFGIKDPLRTDVIDAVKACQDAGIFVRMVTGDNIETAKAIAKECGILTEGGLAMEGPEFRKLTPKQLDEVLPLLQVLARSSPEDKHTLVTRLNGQNLPKNEAEWLEAHPHMNYSDHKDKLLPGYREEWVNSRVNGVGEVVGVTGDGTNDAPALKAADVGLSMGLSGTDVAKEASDIVILDDNFSSIVKAVLWGRSVFDNIRKFLQFQLTVNIVALTITFVSAVYGFDPPLNAVMMLWVNLIMDTLGALALGTEPPSGTLLERHPYKRNTSLISRYMMRNILVQSLFQLVIFYYLLLGPGTEHFGVKNKSIEHNTIIFNVFVLCQLFNELNSRSIDNTMNIFDNLFNNFLFLSVLVFTLVMQFILVEYGSNFMKTTPLSIENWIKCISLASLTLTLGGLMRLIPVVENQDDYAILPPILLKRSNTSVKPSHNLNVFTFSFILWLIVISTIPLYTYTVYESHWIQYLK